MQEEKMTTDDALLELLRSDHLILSGEFARRIGAAFGVSVSAGSIRDTRSQFKGATLEGVEEGEVVHDVIDATELAIQICDGLGVPYASKFGRGSQLRECVAALQEHVEEGV